MAKHFQVEIERLKRKLLNLSSVVEDLVFKAVKSVEQRDATLAESVVKSDNEVDEIEVDVEEECLKILALHQPVAIDLRIVIAVLKINNDLERIGDLACNIADRALSLAQRKKISVVFPFTQMASKVKQMLHESIVSFVNLDVKLARQVCASDPEVDRIHKEVHKLIEDNVKKTPEEIDAYMFYLSVSRNLERIADHATNIAEDVIYMVEGEIVRHIYALEKL
jgi:phosphate transport system protein